MRMLILAIVFALSNLLPVYSRGAQEMHLVNVQEFASNQIDAITVMYGSGRVNLFHTDTDAIIVREFVNRSNGDYFARITNWDGILTVEAGNRPLRGRRNFNRYIEIAVPSGKIITVTTSSGRIEANDTIVASSINLESSSGSISLNRIVAEKINLRAASGSIRGGEIIGNTTVESRSGSIDLGLVSGTINARTSSGSFRSTVTENTGDITIATSSGSVRLDIPRDLVFNFSSRTSSGSLNTPFSERLFSPIDDRRSVHGVIGDSDIHAEERRNIDINTSSGSININWAE
ncbi:MAG: DUF4097 domain-containing protein [Spirochaetes bacterium]|nr:DUF4097 domain-containing protein [Spirochaetota bacterium]